MPEFKKTGQSGKILLFLLLIYAVTSANPMLTIAAVLVPFLLLRLLWKENESPFLFLAFMLQWLSVTVKVFYTNFEGIDFADAFENYQQIKATFYYSLIGLLAVAIGIHLIIRKFDVAPTSYKDLALGYNHKKLIPFYLVVTILYPIFYRFGLNAGGLQQPITKLADFKWMVFFIFMLCALYNRQWKLFGIIAMFEIAMSLTGFFSSFKDYFLVIFGGALVMYGRNLKFKQVLPLAIVALSGIYMLIIWQYVKPSYRKYLNKGELSQNVNRTSEESLNKLTELVGKVDKTAIDEGFKMTVDRLSYIDFFSASIDYVPRVVPHTSGALWSDAIGRVLQPRIFFPNKASIDDSQATNMYTGLGVAGFDRGTSISMGYVAENYIDFGVPGMFVSLFGYGLLIGLIYRYVMTSSPDKLIGSALIIPLFIIIYLFESALNKLIGSLLMYLIIYELFRRFALKKFIGLIKL